MKSSTAFFPLLFFSLSSPAPFSLALSFSSSLSLFVSHSHTPHRGPKPRNIYGSDIPDDFTAPLVSRVSPKRPVSIQRDARPECTLHPPPDAPARRKRDVRVLRVSRIYIARARIRDIPASLRVGCTGASSR